MKSKKFIIGILGVLVILIIVYFGSWLFGINISKLSLSICSSGSRPYSGFFNLAINKGCYMPSVYEGNICNKKSDCGEGFCVIKEKDSKKGFCSDHPTSCQGILNDKGGFGIMCFDF